MHRLRVWLRCGLMLMLRHSHTACSMRPGSGYVLYTTAPDRSVRTEAVLIRRHTALYQCTSASNGFWCYLEDSEGVYTGTASLTGAPANRPAAADYACALTTIWPVTRTCVRTRADRSLPHGAATVLRWLALF